MAAKPSPSEHATDYRGKQSAASDQQGGNKLAESRPDHQQPVAELPSELAKAADHLDTDTIEHGATQFETNPSEASETKNTELKTSELGSTELEPTKPGQTEHGGPKGLEPTRYGDWERNGRCTDF